MWSKKFRIEPAKTDRDVIRVEVDGKHVEDYGVLCDTILRKEEVSVSVMLKPVGLAFCILSSLRLLAQKPPRWRSTATLLAAHPEPTHCGRSKGWGQEGDSLLARGQPTVGASKGLGEL